MGPSVLIAIQFSAMDSGRSLGRSGPVTSRSSVVALLGLYSPGLGTYAYLRFWKTAVHKELSSASGKPVGKMQSRPDCFQIPSIR